MKPPALSCRMSAADAAFLYLERKELPLHIASVCLFDGPIPIREFRASIDAKLQFVPRYLQIPSIPQLDLDFPTWQHDPHFDIGRHVIPVTLPAPGGEAELQAFASRILSGLLERDKPLWDVHVVDGLQDGRGALIWRVHHSLADGMSGAELMRLLLHSTPDAPPVAPGRRRRKARAETAQAMGADPLGSTLNSTLDTLLHLESGILDFAKAALGGGKPNSSPNNQNPLKALMGLLPEFTASIERLPFNKPCTGERKFCWTEFDLADVQAIREAAGGTINDVILAVLTRALGHYVKLHKQTVVRRFVRIVCPVNLRPPGEQNGMGNQISFLPVALPMDARGPLGTLQAVTARTETLKRSGALGLAALAVKWLTLTPAPLQAFFWRNIPELILPVPLLNMICTNVVGSSTPLYAAGRRMLAAYPQVPTGWDLGIGCAAHSYDGKLFFGLISDTHAAPDADRLRDFLVLAFQELRRAVVHKSGRGSYRATPKIQTPSEPRREPVPAAVPDSRGGSTPGHVAVAGHSKEAA